MLKLIANRPQDLDDLHNIVKSGQRIDLAYVRDWCEKLDEDFATGSRFRLFEAAYLERKD